MALLMLVGPKCCGDIVWIESFSVNVMKGKFWCMLLWFIFGKCPTANFKKGYSAGRWGINYYTRLDLLG